jgi:hypothetical protein
LPGNLSGIIVTDLSGGFVPELFLTGYLELFTFYFIWFAVLFLQETDN